MQHSCSHSNAICHHSFKNRIELRTQTQPLVAKHIEGTKRPQPHPPHRRGTFHRRLQPLYAEKHKVSCSSFLPNTKPMQHHAAIPMRSANTNFKKRIELRTQEQPLVAKHIGGTIGDRNVRSRNRRTDEVPFIAGCSHFTRKNPRFRALCFLPNTKPMQHSCSHSNAICHHSSKKRIELRTQDTTTHCKTLIGGTIRAQKRPQPQPPHRRGTFHRRLQPLYTEKRKVSCSGFLPKT